MKVVFPEQKFYNNRRRSPLLTDATIIASCLLSGFLIAHISSPAEGWG